MDSTRGEENEYSSIDYGRLAVDRESTNWTSRSQLRSSKGNTYEEPSSAVKKREQKMFEPGETLPLVKTEEGKKQNSQESICSRKCGLLILFILLTSVFALLFCLYYLEVVKLKAREVETQKETMLNKEISQLQNNTAVSNLKASIDFSQILLATINEQKKIISEKEAVIVSHDVDINRLKNKINEHTSVMLLGGWHDFITNSTAIYNSIENSWKNCKLTLPSTLARHGAAIINNEIYIFGGLDGETDDSLKSLYKLGADNKWERMADMNEKRSEISRSSIVFNSEIWVIGGWYGTHTLNTVEKYNPKTNSWTKMPNLLEARYAAAASLIDGKIYVSGGYDKAWLKTIEVYNPAKNKWEYFCHLPYGLTDHCSVADGTNLMIIGGKRADNTFSNDIWKINITDPEKEWKKMPSFKQERRYHGAVKLEDSLMIFGGFLNFPMRFNSVEIFDGTSWSEGPPMSEKFGEFAFIPITRKQEKSFVRQFCRTE